MSSPVRLKKEESTMNNNSRIDRFCKKYTYLLLPICIIVLLFLVIALVSTLVSVIVDTSSINISVVDSGNYYYHLKDVI